ncbi:Peptidase A1 [Macleaya cordata]|uniref:Peptidase A1 n=1 Tax=Macleaya cordata TaxID=56857 RepID=A0A200RBQ0_MACCD|nr:Peptidase A1 [Macleaya cordata]
MSAMAANFSSFVLFVLLSMSYLFTISFITSVHGNSFSVDLIHRDSPLSLFYNASEKPSDRVQKAIHRSINRVNNHFIKKSSVSTDNLTSTLIPNSGEYLMKISLGTPSHEILAVADTGSDLTWTQCKPCVHCYKQIAPLFDPKKSSTYKDLSCSSRPCVALGSTSVVSCGEREACVYNISYGGHSYTFGKLALETFTFNSTSGGPPIKVPKIAFGCGYNNAGIFEEHWSGLVGLSAGPSSLISQLGSMIDFKFSYCLVNPFDSKSKKKSSKMNFGSNAEISGKGVISTPLVPKSDATFYYLTLEGLSVGEKRIAYYKNSSSSSKTVDDASTVDHEEEGNIVIDSGTVATLLPPDFYEKIESEVKKAIDLEPTTAPQGLSLCYRYSDDLDVKIPTITAHFTGADIVLKPLNTFIEADKGVMCLALIPYEKVSIFGNLAQMNFLVEYDLENKKVSFKPTDCTKQEE